MPSVRYYNQSAPFWDFVASLEEEGSPQAYAGPHGHRGHHHDGEPGPSMPWGQGRRGLWRHETPAGPPPPDNEDGQAASDGNETTPTFEGEPENNEDKRERGHPFFGKGRGGWGGRGRGGCGSRGRGHWGHGVHGRGPAWGMGGGPFGMPNLGEIFRDQFFGSTQSGSGDQDWSPDVDVFDTETSFVIHASLAGAKKEDIAVSWDAEKSELTITGVIHRPGDEDFLRNLALDERKVGAFERKVRLGSRANPAQVDADSITAKLEEGVLRIDAPKEDKDYVDVKKVDIE